MNNVITPLLEGLNELNEWLSEKHLTIRISIIGRFAFYLAGIRHLATLDIDSVTEIDDEVFNKIIQIGTHRGMKPEWLNDNAGNLPLPEGFNERLIDSTTDYSNIKIKYASNKDLISLKAAAYISRGEDDPKDFQDLLLLKPSESEIENAIVYIRQHFAPPAVKFFPDFEEKLNELRSISKR